MARPTRLTDSVRNTLVLALSSGCYRATAAQHAGIGVSTLYYWLEKGEADHDAEKESPHRELYEAIQKAEADAELAAVAQIRAASKRNWQAAAWMLERKHPRRWGRRDGVKVEHSGTVTTVEFPVDAQERSRRAAMLLRDMGALDVGDGDEG